MNLWPAAHPEDGSGPDRPTPARPDLPAPEAINQAVTLENLRRLRWMGLAVPALNLLYIALLWPAADAAPHTQRWQEALLRLHLVMAPCFALIGLVAQWLLQARAAPAVLRRAWPLLAATLSMAFTITFVAIDQAMGANVSAFLLGSVLTGVLIVVHPLGSSLLYGAALVAFWVVLGLTQPDPMALLSNQLNGTSGGVLGWVLAVLSWRQQRRQTELTLRLQQAATTDSLTGVANRMETVRLVNEELARGQRHGHATSLLLLDLDHFKQVNDRLGHPGGDRVLQRTAAALQQTLRVHDHIGRLGGEEFLVLLPQTDAQAAQQLAERLRLHLAQTLAAEGGVTCSIGFVTARPGHATGFDQLYLQADRALYRAKTGGRNRSEAAV